MQRFAYVAFASATLTLCGCQEQRTVVMEQAQAGAAGGYGAYASPPPAPPPRPAAQIASPCAPPAGSGPYQLMPRPIATQNVPKPARALAEHVAGCGGVRFRIGPNGEPEDVTVLADYPVGYGFGDTVRQMIETSRWSPRDDLAWHYLNATIHPPA